MFVPHRATFESPPEDRPYSALRTHHNADDWETGYRDPDPDGVLAEIFFTLSDARREINAARHACRQKALDDALDHAEAHIDRAMSALPGGCK